MPRKISGELETTEFMDSPYKNLKKIKADPILDDSTNDAADFRSPDPIKKPKKLLEKLGKPVAQKNIKGKIPSKRGRKPKKITSSQNSTLKIISNNFQYFGENPEHMQLAIALSKSSYEAESGSSQSSSREEEANISNLLRNSKPAFLERFGFTSDRKILPVQNRRMSPISIEPSKKAKGRFKYITPILNIRSAEERDSLISSKISVILCQNISEPKKRHEQTTNSDRLTTYICKERSIFNLDGIYKENNFYVKTLQIPPSEHKCGHLLKDWNLIPGRDRSPGKADHTEGDTDNSCEEIVGSMFAGNSTKTIDTLRDTTRGITDTTSNRTIPVESTLKNISSPNLNSCSSTSVSTAIDKTSLGSLNSETKASTSPKPTLQSPSRSISPDLFGSDDETDQRLVTKTQNDPINCSGEGGVSLSIHTTEVDANRYGEVGADSPLKKDEVSEVNNVEVSEVDINNTNTSFSDKTSYFKTNEIEMKGYSFIEKIDVGMLPVDIIDLTDDDESEDKNLGINICNQSSIKPLQPNSQIKKSSNAKIPNIYNLDEFENEDINEMGSRRENNDDTKNIINTNKNKNNFTDIKDRSSDCSGNNDNEIEVINAFGQNPTLKKNVDTYYTKIINNVTETGCFSSTPAKSDITTPFFRNSEVNPSIHIINLVDDTPSNPQCTNNEMKNIKNGIETEQVSHLYETPKRNQRSKSSFDDESTHVNKTCRNTNIARSPYFDEPYLYDSTDLNVTDYVNNMLSQETGFDKIIRYDENDLGVEQQLVINNDEEMSSSQSSQNSVVVDEELNYSSHFATPARYNTVARSDCKRLHDEEVIILDDVTFQATESEEHDALETSTAPKNSVINPVTMSKSTTNQVSTPDNFIIKTDDVTPMPDYDTMTTPLISRELQKFGIKPLKRTRGAKLLTYIYESTHPIVDLKENVPDDPESDDDQIIKRRKTSHKELNNLERYSLGSDNSSLSHFPLKYIIGDHIIANEKPEDLIFERKQLKKIASCQVPLQIAWHNLVSCHTAIKENILLYEPLQLESLHMMLKEEGFKFHIQDLLTFLDKKCITIRTAQKQGRIPR